MNNYVTIELKYIRVEITVFVFGTKMQNCYKDYTIKM